MMLGICSSSSKGNPYNAPLHRKCFSLATPARLAWFSLRLNESFDRFSPDIVFYNAGTDILVGDPLGNMMISPEAVVDRDEIVMGKCQQNNVPVVMLLSGGYTKPLSAETIARSILNMRDKLGLVQWQAKRT